MTSGVGSPGLIPPTFEIHSPYVCALTPKSFGLSMPDADYFGRLSLGRIASPACRWHWHWDSRWPVGVGGWGWEAQGPGMGVIKWPLAGPGDKLDLEGGCSTNYTAANDFVPYQPHAEKISLYWMVYESLVMVQVLNPYYYCSLENKY